MVSPTRSPRGSNAFRSSCFSEASARSGTMYSAFPPFRTLFRIARYDTRDFPLAVGIARTRFFPANAGPIASAWGGGRSLVARYPPAWGGRGAGAQAARGPDGAGARGAPQ